MNQRNRTAVIGLVAGVLVVVLWWVLVFSPIRSDSNDVSDEIDTARAEQQSLEATLAQLESLQQRGPEVEAELARLRQGVPDTPDLASFILAANDLANVSGINWVSIAPSEPALVGAVSTIQMSVQIEGGYYQVLEYLNRLEDLERLVVIDTISLSAAGSSDTAGGASFGGAPPLTAALTARMFSAGAPGAGAVTEPAAGPVDGPTDPGVEE